MRRASRTAGRSSLGGGTRGALSGLLPQPMLKGQRRNFVSILRLGYRWSFRRPPPARWMRPPSGTRLSYGREMHASGVLISFTCGLFSIELRPNEFSCSQFFIVTPSKSGECFCGRRCSGRCPQRMMHSGSHPTKGAGCGRAPALRSRPWNSSKSFLAEFLWASHLEWSTALTPVRSFSTSSWSS